jgi:hypothetical protein
LVAGVIVALAFLVGGWVLMRRTASRGGLIVTVGAVFLLASEIYGLAVLKPFVGRPFDDLWYEQIATVEALATLGLLICAAGVVAHALKLPKR